ncbi:hypothetical protein TIFTF001_002624 [Ficus carica]|uniref:Uncharacterized protein n=1 Tax=Ficus carica TaxID=3494 RepID=A0AA87ZV88_FICCA|nr:hypothetical protein TIFTF001_002624 [Ficus carica]
MSFSDNTIGDQRLKLASSRLREGRSGEGEVGDHEQSAARGQIQQRKVKERVDSSGCTEIRRHEDRSERALRRSKIAISAAGWRIRHQRVKERCHRGGGVL